MYVEKHIFKHSPDTKKKLPKSYYSDVTYNDDLKVSVVSLGNYFSVPYDNNFIQKSIKDDKRKNKSIRRI